VLFLTLGAEDSGELIALRFQVERREKGAYVDPATRAEDFLAPERLVPNSGEFGKIAGEVLLGKKGDLLRAYALARSTITRSIACAI
jgi:hypothetical protein